MFEHRTTRSRRGLLIAGAGLLALAIVWAWLPRYEALLVLGDLAAGAAQSRLERVTPVPRRSSVAYEHAGRRRTGHLYVPGAAAARATMVLVPGVVPEGIDDARFVAFATTLARAGFIVLTPDMPGYRKLALNSSDVRVVADAFAWLASRPDLGHAAAAGIGALSYAVSPAVLAALEPDIAQRVRFVLAIGGCYDLHACVQFFTTGAAHRLENRREADASEYGKLVFARSSLAHVGAADRAILEVMIEARLRGRAAKLPMLAERLSPAARSVYELLVNTDAQRTASLLRALPASLQAELAALDLAQRDLSALRAQLLLVHGRNDPLVPYEQSERLAGAVAEGQARLFIIGDVFRHVEFELSGVFSREFITRELPDAWKLWRAVDAVLDQRAIRAEPRASTVTSGHRDTRAVALVRSSPARGKTR
jgi:hypothetical protein